MRAFNVTVHASKVCQKERCGTCLASFYYHVSSMCSNVFHMVLLLPTIQLLESSYNQYIATLDHDVMQSMSAAASKQRNKG
jgi:hypothetical protein